MTFCGSEKKLFVFVVVLHCQVQKRFNGTRIMRTLPVNSKISFLRVHLVKKKLLDLKKQGKMFGNMET